MARALRFSGADIGRNGSGLALLTKFNVKQHGWREFSCVSRVGRVVFWAFVSEAFFALENAWNRSVSDLSVVPKKKCALNVQH